MILTLKAKEDFEKWYIKKDVSDDEFYNIWEEWSNLSTSCKNAFYIDFFDSVGIYINALRYNKQWWKAIAEYEYARIFNSRQEALTKAIEKANKIYNEKI